MFHPEDLVTVDVLEYIRREQSRFFRGGVYNPVEVASQIALEALLLGVSGVQITRQGDWIAVASESDWLSGLEEDAFHQFAPIRGDGRNAVTVEVFLTVFARGVVTAKNGKTVIIKGDSLGPLAESVPTSGRVVAFMVASE
ncbi:hypothetical protein F7R91_22635 [Streptomyces luteolifulvus]|uniref:Uncharacterized protein n=1 Tax=Streptomyces luteolifulvus TaxID=2615112 RepID=A0A6H9UXW6_9ACTN|nr:hypothetical protein [Streptomyces luteolifulvus]KAB1144160.1 hypothetical protein F7R91_22635 [Streptomyces luteolifulvus]